MMFVGPDIKFSLQKLWLNFGETSRGEFYSTITLADTFGSFNKFLSKFIIFNEMTNEVVCQIKAYNEGKLTDCMKI